MEKAIIINCRKEHYCYKIVVQSSYKNTMVALAGFCAEEHTENILFSQLQNVCLQSNGNFNITHSLLNKLVFQWQHTFNMPAVQTLQFLTENFINQKLVSMLVYKGVGEEEKVVKRVFL